MVLRRPCDRRGCGVARVVSQVSGVDRTQEAFNIAVELRVLIREAHGVLKDLRQMKREMDEYFGDAIESVDKVLGAAVKSGLEQYEDTIRKANEDATARVFARFDEIMAIMTGKDNSGDSDLDKAARRYRVMTEMAIAPSVPRVFRRKDEQ